MQLGKIRPGIIHTRNSPFAPISLLLFSVNNVQPYVKNAVIMSGGHSNFRYEKNLIERNFMAIILFNGIFVQTIIIHGRPLNPER